MLKQTHLVVYQA